MDAVSLATAALSALLAVVAAVVLLGKGSGHRLARGIRESWGVVAIAIAAIAVERTAAAVAMGRLVPLASVPSSGHVLQPLMVWLQEVVPSSVGVPFFGSIYVAAFIFLLAFVPLVLLGTDRDRFTTYAMALVLAYGTSLALHALVGSVRPGLDPSSGIAPLLYDDPFWGTVSADLMSRGSSFPSIHVTVVTIMLLSTWGIERLGTVGLATLLAMALGVLYLGVHWPIDIVAGLLTGAAGHVAVVAIKRRIAGNGFIRWRPG